MRTHLVIGCGYLGRRVAASRVVTGHRVYATTRRAARAAELRALGAEPVVCNVLVPEGLSALPDAEVVVYCIGFDRAAGRSMREVYVGGLGNVLAELARREAAGARPARFVYVSSTGVYGQSDGGWVDEAAATEPVEESGRVVLEAERLLRGRRPDAVVLRFAGIYGPGRLIGATAVRESEPLSGDPDRWLNLIHVEDGAAAVEGAAARGRPGEVYNVCDGRPVRRRDFYARLADVLGVPPPRFAAPACPDPGRRVLNRRMREELGVALRYPSYEEGLPASL